METHCISRQYSQLNRIFWTGVAILVAWAIILVIIGFWKPDPYADGWILVVQLMFLGRLVSNATGVQLGFSDDYLLFQSIVQDTWLTLIFMPLLINAYYGTTRARGLGRIVAATRKSAEANRAVVEPFGIVGLWLFVFFPFASTGVMVGGFLGFLIGMRLWVILATILSAHVLSCIATIFVSIEVKESLAALDNRYTHYLVWLAIAVVVVGSLGYGRYVSMRDKRRRAVSSTSTNDETLSGPK